MLASAVIAVAGCDGAGDPGQGTPDDSTRDSAAGTGRQTPMTEQEAREAAEAEQPETEARLREVARLTHPDLGRLETVGRRGRVVLVLVQRVADAGAFDDGDRGRARHGRYGTAP